SRRRQGGNRSQVATEKNAARSHTSSSPSHPSIPSTISLVGSSGEVDRVADVGSTRGRERNRYGDGFCRIRAVSAGRRDGGSGGVGDCCTADLPGIGGVRATQLSFQGVIGAGTVGLGDQNVHRRADSEARPRDDAASHVGGDTSEGRDVAKGQRGR